MTMVLFIVLAVLFVVLETTNGKSCLSPPTPLYSLGKLSDPTLVPGTSLTFTCDAGYELFGEGTLVCSEEGTWQGTLPYCATNVAYKKPTNQSSTAKGGSPDNGNDGDKTTVHDGQRCTQTLKEPSPWWSTDLLQPHEVRVVRVITRGCCGTEPLHDLEIRIGNNSHIQSNPLCAWYPDTLEEGKSKEFKCARPMTGQYVSIQMAGVESVLSICELEVFTTQEFSKSRCVTDVDSDQVSVFNRMCYEFQTKIGGSFEDARKYCEKHKGNLLNTVDHETHHFISTELERMKDDLQNKLVWIGAQKEPSFISRIWRWLPGNNVVSKPMWGKDQPNNYNKEQNCVVLDGDRNWLWNDVGCNLDYLPWICQSKPGSCGSPDKNLNTTILGNNYEKFSKIEYTCPEGNMVVGDRFRECQETGFWSGMPPTCKYVDCGQPPSAVEASYQLLDRRTTFNASIKYSCNENYTLVGKEVKRCHEDGHWDEGEIKCLYYWCDDLQSLPNGTVELTGLTAGSQAKFSCDPGHKLVGPSSITCELGGKWSDSSPTCSYIDCGLPSPVNNGGYSLVNSSTTFQSVVKYTCEADYWLMGPDTLWCLDNGKWSASAPTCEIITCEEPEVPPGSFVTGYDFTVRSEVEYHCENGHYITGEPKRACGTSGEWSGETPECIFVDCGRLAPILKGALSYSNDTTYLGSVVQYTCINGFKLVGDGVRKCLIDSMWSGDTPKCEEVRCSEPTHPQNAILSVSGNDRIRNIVRTRLSHSGSLPQMTYRVGSLLSYRCEKGYRLDGESTKKCLNNGVWSPESPSCTYVKCSPPPNITHGLTDTQEEEFAFGVTVVYSCDVGYHLVGRKSMDCTADGTWSTEAPACEETLCEQPDKGEGVLEVLVDSLKIGGKATYICEEGKIVSGVASRVCEPSGSWSDTSPTCDWAHCGPPEEVDNGRIYVTDKSYVYGSVVEYHCLPNFYRVGPFTRKCLDTGLWSGVQPNCTDDITEITSNDLGDGSSERNYEVQSGNNVGMWVGIGAGVTLLFIVVVLVACFKMRSVPPVKSPPLPPIPSYPSDNQMMDAMSYSSLSSFQRQNGCYDTVTEDEPVYSEPNYADMKSPTYVNGSIHSEPSPYASEHFPKVDGTVTVNGVAIR